MEKERWEESEKRKAEETSSEKRKSQEKEDAGARKGRKVAKHCVFPMFCASGGSKGKLAKAAGAEPTGQMRDQELHAAVARSRFGNQHAKNISASEHFWKLSCWKSARGCGAKHVSKSKGAKHTRSGDLWKLKLRCWKVHAVAARSTFRSQNAKTTQCRTAFRSCIFEKMHPWRSRSTFGCWDVEKVHAVVARSTKSKVLKTDGLGPLLDVQMSKNWTLTVC